MSRLPSALWLALGLSACTAPATLRLPDDAPQGARALLWIDSADGVGFAADLPVDLALLLPRQPLELWFYDQPLAALAIPPGLLVIAPGAGGCDLPSPLRRYPFNGSEFGKGTSDPPPVPVRAGLNLDSQLLHVGSDVLFSSCDACLPRGHQDGCDLRVSFDKDHCTQSKDLVGRISLGPTVQIQPLEDWTQCHAIPPDAVSFGGTECDVSRINSCAFEAFRPPPTLSASIAISLPVYGVRQQVTYSYLHPRQGYLGGLAQSRRGQLFTSATRGIDNLDCCIRTADHPDVCIPVTHNLVRVDPETLALTLLDTPCTSLLAQDPEGNGVLAALPLEHRIARIDADGQVTARSPVLWGSGVLHNFVGAMSLDEHGKNLYIAVENIEDGVLDNPRTQVLAVDVASLSVTATSAVYPLTQLTSLHSIGRDQMLGLDEKLDTVFRLRQIPTGSVAVLSLEGLLIGQNLHFAGDLQGGHWELAFDFSRNQIYVSPIDFLTIPNLVQVKVLAGYENRRVVQSAAPIAHTPAGTEPQILVGLVQPATGFGTYEVGPAGFVRVEIGARPRILPGQFDFTLPDGGQINDIGLMLTAPDGSIFGILPSDGRVFRLRLP
ncbi:MAG: hypothetical protein U1E65_10190 [Myxococcota bacterium]